MATNAYINLCTDVSGNAADTNKEWNNISHYTTGSEVSGGIDDEDNVSTGWTCVIGDLPFEGEGSSGVVAVGTGAAAWVDEAKISEEFHWMTTAAQIGEFDFAGLDNAKTYKIEVFASRTAAGNRITEYSVNGFSSVFGEIDPVGNSTITASVSGVSPAGGALTLSVRHKSGEDVGYINAIWIQEEDAAGGRIMSSIANLGGLAGSGGIAGQGGGIAG